MNPVGKILGSFNRRFHNKNDWDGDGVSNKKDCQPRNTMRQDDFYRDSDGKISATKLSPFGKKQLVILQGVKLYFKHSTLKIRGNSLVDDYTGKVVKKINNDRLVNKILFKVI